MLPAEWRRRGACGLRPRRSRLGRAPVYTGCMNTIQSRLRSLAIVPVTWLAPALALLPALSLAIGCTTSAPKEVAATIYTGGTIITVNEAQPTAGAIAVKDGKILAVGDEAGILKFKGDATEVVNLGGKTMLPGFIDAHGHVFNVGVQAVAANLLAPPDGQVTDIASLQAALRAWAEKSPAAVARTG